MKALLLVDIQNDFMPDGSLPVPGGDQVVPVANKLMSNFEHIVATQDWHPADHKSFASQHDGHEQGDTIEWNGVEQMLWPDHCVQESDGAMFHPDLDQKPIQAIIRKGMDPDIDSYSGFYDNGHKVDTGLGAYLRGKGIDQVYIVGLATDVCVKYTALDAVKEGFKTYIVEDGVRGVNMNEGDVEKAMGEMQRTGAEVVQSVDIE